MNPVFPQLSSLSRAEKLQLVEDLWDEIGATPAALPVLDWQKQELARRKAEYLQNPAIGNSWEDLILPSPKGTGILEESTNGSSKALSIRRY